MEAYKADSKLTIMVSVSTTKCSADDIVATVEEISSTLQPLCDKYQIELDPMMTMKGFSLKKQG